MASIANDNGGRRRIQFLDGDARRTIRLGKMSERSAIAIKVRIEALIGARIAGHPVDEDTARWVANLDDGLHVKLAKVGLVRPRDAAELGPFLEEFIASKGHLSANAMRNLLHARNWLLKHLDPTIDLRSITADDAAAWRLFMLRTLSENSVRGHAKKIKEIFKHAVERGLITTNPFAKLPTTIRSNPKRFRFINRATIEAVLDACPDPQWRAIVALARYGGLRCPSEVLRLRWSDIDWERDRITVTDEKRSRSGRPVRVVPLFPELARHLQAAFDEAAPGDQFVITRYRQTESNLRTQFHRIIRRAGFEPWTKPFQNLRSTRETELAETFALHVVTAWLGNTQSVAMEHYLQVTEDHYRRATADGADEAGAAARPSRRRGRAKAAQNAAHDTAQQTQVGPRNGSQRVGADSAQVPENKEALAGLPRVADSCESFRVPPRGFEPLLPD